MPELTGQRVAIIATNGFEEQELTEPMKALKEAGAQVDVIAPTSGHIQAFRHHDKGITVPVDRTLDEAQPSDYTALMLPGGALNADEMRIHPKAQEFIRATQANGKPIAAICHAPWELISSGVMQGRTVTSFKTIQDDIRNAGGQWVDQEVVEDKNWVTSRQPSDLPAFNTAMIRLFSRVPSMR